MPVFDGGFRVREVVKNKKALKKFRKDRAEYPKKKDKGYNCPAK